MEKGDEKSRLEGGLKAERRGPRAATRRAWLRESCGLIRSSSNGLFFLCFQTLLKKSTSTVMWHNFPKEGDKCPIMEQSWNNISQLALSHQSSMIFLKHV